MSFKEHIFKKPGFSRVSKSEILNTKAVSTRIPALNLIISGSPNGGIKPGLTQIVGDSATFKTSYCLEFAHAFLEEHRAHDPVVLFYSNEHGATPEYFYNFGISDDDVAYKPFDGIEDLIHGIQNDIEPITMKDKVLIIIDSIGMAASKKEADDMMAGEDKTDMTRAKKLNSFARVITPRLKSRGIPCLAINHYYSTQEMYSKRVVGGGTKLYLGSDVVLFTSAKKLKDAKDKVVGQSFGITALKSRYVKSGLQVSIDIHEKQGIDQYSGIAELGIHSNFFKKVDKSKCKEIGLDGRKTWVEYDGKHFVSNDIPKDALEKLLKDNKFDEWCMSNYTLGGNGQNGIYGEESVVFDLPEDDNDDAEDPTEKDS
jgi:RecA/RadA recombinase